MPRAALLRAALPRGAAELPPRTPTGLSTRCRVSSVPGSLENAWQSFSVSVRSSRPLLMSLCLFTSCESLALIACLRSPTVLLPLSSKSYAFPSIILQWIVYVASSLSVSTKLEYADDIALERSERADNTARTDVVRSHPAHRKKKKSAVGGQRDGQRGAGTGVMGKKRLRYTCVWIDFAPRGATDVAFIESSSF